MSSIRPEDENHQTPTGRSSKPFFYGYVVVAAGFIIWLVGGGIFTPAFSVFLKPIIDEYGWTRAETTLGLSLATITQGFLAIVMGRLTDKLGPRIVIAGFGSFLGISYLIMSQVTDLWQFQLNYALVLAIGLSTIITPMMAVIARWFENRRGLMMGIVQSGVGIGGFIFSPFMAWLISEYSWRYAYVVIGGIALAGIIIPGLFLRDSPSEDKQLPTSGNSARPVKPEEERDKNTSTTAHALSGIFSSNQFWIIAGFFATFGFCRSAFLSQTVAYVQDKGFSLFDGANVVAIITMTSIFGRIIMGRVADVIGIRPTLITSELLTTISLIVGLLSGNLWGLYLYGIIFGFGWGAQAVLRYSLISESFDMASIGFIMGVLGVAEALAASAGSYFAGYIFDLVGTYAPAFWVGIAVSAFSVILSFMKLVTVEK